MLLTVNFMSLKPGMEESFEGICFCGKECCQLALPWKMASQYADNAARVDGDSTPYCVDCCSYALLMPLLSCCCIAGTKRSVLRASLGMPRQDVCDKATHLVCPCCALMQEKRILDKHKFTHANPASAHNKAPEAENMNRGAGEAFDKL